MVGVPFDDVLNLRAAPGVDQRTVARLDPLADDVVATGAARQLAQSIWHEVTAEGVTGWANRAFLAWLGDKGTYSVRSSRCKAPWDIGILHSDSPSQRPPHFNSGQHRPMPS